MWLLAVASLVTVGQRVHSVRSSPGAMDKIEPARRAGQCRAVITTPARLFTAGRKRLPSGENLADWGYAAGWRVVRADAGVRSPATPSTPAPATRRCGGGPEQLRKNLARVIGTTPAEVPDSLMRASLASYARYWREAFRLPSMDLDAVALRLDEVVIGKENVDAAYAAGRGVIMALPHSGNWDMAGVWLVHH